MAARVTTDHGDAAPSLDELRTHLSSAGLEARTFRNAPGDRYGWHEHGRHKILYCVEGSITFHTREGDHLLEEGDRIDLEPGTAHAATVHDDGVTCIEAYAEGPDDLPR